jgi:hypothetical protein
MVQMSLTSYKSSLLIELEKDIQPVCPVPVKEVGIVWLAVNRFS